MYCWNKNFELIQNTHFMDIEEKIYKFCRGKKNIQCLWRCLVEHTKTFFLAKWKMHANFLMFYSKNYIFVTKLLHWSGKNIGWKIICHGCWKRIIKHLAKKSFRVFNRTPSDTVKQMRQYNLLLFFFNIHEKWVL